MVTSNNNCFFSETGQFGNVENASLDKDHEGFIAWIKNLIYVLLSALDEIWVEYN